MGYTSLIGELYEQINGPGGLATTVGQANGAATLDGTGKLTAGQVPGSVVSVPSGPQAAAKLQQGIYVPAGWGQFWYPKLALAKAGTGKATLAVIGDSLSQGGFASNPLTKSWVALLTAALQSAYGDGGSGYIGTQFSNLFMSGASAPAALRTAWAAIANALYTVTGTWTATAMFGPGVALFSTTAADTLALAGLRGTTISAISTKNPGNGSFTWAIDGGGARTVATNAAAGAQRDTAPDVAAGSHSVLATIVGGANTYVNGFSAENAAGVVVNNFGVWGRKSADWAQTTFGPPAAWSGGASYPADLVIYALSANDGGNNVTGDVWAENARTALQTYIRDNATQNGATDILVVLQHAGTNEGANNKYLDYAARLPGICEGLNAAYVNVWNLGRNSWNYWNSLSYWGNTATPGAAGTDGIHLSDAGHQAIYNAVAPLVVATN